MIDIESKYSAEINNIQKLEFQIMKSVFLDHV